MKKLILFCFLFPVFFTSQSQVDSVLQVISKQKEDTAKVNSFNDLGKLYEAKRSYTLALEAHNNAIALSKKIDYKKGEASGLNNIGVVYSDQSKFKEALQKYEEALEIRLKINDKKSLGSSYNNIGNIYQVTGDYPRALENYLRSLKLKQELGDKKGMGFSYFNIGILYKLQHDQKRALENLYRSLTIRLELGNQKEIAFVYNGLGNAYFDGSDTAKAMEFYKKAYEIRKEAGDKYGMGSSMNNMGIVYQAQKQYEKALECYDAALVTKKEIGDKRGIISSTINKCQVNIILKKKAGISAELYHALDLAREIGTKENLEIGYLILSRLDSLEGDYKNAFTHYKLYIGYRDSLINENNKERSVRAEMNFEFEKKETEAKLIQLKKDAIADTELHKQALIRNCFIIGFILLLILAIVVYRSYKEKERANIIIEEKNKEITDSINYAKRIQNTLLAHREFLLQNLPEFFVLFNPKAIVSGDFYWATKVGNRFYLAVADSTGHGVPGAFMSLLNIGFLSEAINEKGITEPNMVLDYVREKLIANMSKEDQKDGFDGILVCFENGTKKITYAAAHNAPLLLRNKELLELDTDKMPVGYGERKENFKLYSIQATKGDLLYLFTDGYADQFGGPKNKKMMYKRMHKIILDSAERSLEEQKKDLEKQFDDWKGKAEQVDDVCIFGIKLT